MIQVEYLNTATNVVDLVSHGKPDVMLEWFWSAFELLTELSVFLLHV